MKLATSSWQDGARIPSRYAAGRDDGAGGVTFSDNLNPQLAWSGAPPATRSYALICHDPDVPSRGDDVNLKDREVPAELPRVDFYHWVLVDLPPGLQAIGEGEFSRGFTPRGKRGPASAHGSRQGLNDYVGWFASNPEMAGDYYGYDGPFPPFNDAIVHRYVYTLYALSVDRLEVDGAFTGPQVLVAMKGKVLAEASLTGLYTLNARLRA